MENKTVYVAGKISGNENYLTDFENAVKKLKEQGYERILNPCCLPSNLEYEQYMIICFAMIDAADVVFFQKNWKGSAGAEREEKYAISKCKQRVYEGIENA